MPVTLHILSLMDTYAAANSLAVSSVGAYATGDARMYSRLARGKGITVRRAARIIRWFSDHWPADLAWPSGIPRPPPAPDSPAALADAERQNLNNGGDYSDSGALDDRGQLADPKALAESLAPLVNDAFIAAYLDTYYQVVRQYKDGGPRGDQSPRRGSRARQVLDALVEAGDVRFARRVAARRVVPRVADLLREAR